MNSMQSKILRWFSAATAVAMLAGCSSGGAPTVDNPVTHGAPGVRLHRSRFGQRRRAGLPHQPVGEHQGQQPLRLLPRRRRPDADVRAQRRREPRLPAANTVVNLTQPDQSRMVAKVAGGHNCWLQSPSACGDTLTVWIRNWAGASATGGTQIQLQAPTIKEVGGSKSFPAISAAFGASCSVCAGAQPGHGELRALPLLERGRRSSSRSSRMRTSTRPTRPSSRRSISTTRRSRASSCACATSSTTAGATRVARPTRRPCSTRSTRSPTAFRSRTSIRGCSSPRGSRCTTARSPPAATASKRPRSPSTSSRPAWATSPTTPAVTSRR